ncbi:MAG: hypothetical protein NTW29_09080 [Bacteroidetes bacterium]|nr:hypothetical protein [Bacteroidota bacterium]
MAIYEKTTNSDLKQTEVHLYGSSRLGTYKMDRNVENPEVNTTGIYTFTRGNKFFELSNSLLFNNNRFFNFFDMKKN